jgi:AraC family transcriptional regulator
MIRRIDELQFIRGSTRREIYRRVGFAADYIHTNYAQSLDLGELARVACLSKYHFLRLFALVHGITPHAYLQRERTNVAVRLLRTTRLTVGEVAERVGFAERSTLLRRLRRCMGSTSVQIREQVSSGHAPLATNRYSQPSHP